MVAGADWSGGIPQQSILIVEEDEVTRTGLSSMARSVPFVENVDACDDPDSAVAIVRCCCPSILLISGKFGARRTEALRQEADSHGVKYIITIGRGSSRDDVLDMIAYGVIFIEDLTTQSLADTLKCLVNDHAVLPAAFLQEMLRASASRATTPPQGFPKLTPRELEVLTFVADGLSNRQIARRICMSENGVKRHIANLLAKLNCPNRTLAVSYAIEAGLLGRSGEPSDRP